jgi:hypothetical protein
MELWSAFLSAIIDGRRGELERHCHGIVVTGHGEHVSEHSRQLIRKTSLALALAIRSDVRLAEAVVNPEPPRRRYGNPPRQDDCR